jgi:hypothetical protein
MDDATDFKPSQHAPIRAEALLAGKKVVGNPATISTRRLGISALFFIEEAVNLRVGKQGVP